MGTDACPKCGSTERKGGRIYQAGTVYGLRFKSDAATFPSFGEDVAAVACPKCGYVELHLSAPLRRARRGKAPPAASRAADEPPDASSGTAGGAKRPRR